MIAFVTTHEPPLWLMVCGHKFYRKFVLVTLYKDEYAISFGELYKSIKAWIGCSDRTLCHNIHILRHIHKQWAKEQVQLGTLGTWRRATKDLNLQGAVAGGCLWMDSFDIRLSSKHCASCKDPLWSYKANSPAKWFMALSDACSQFCALWGRYSPKIYDGNFLKMQQDFIDLNLSGAVVLANNHFEWGKSKFHRVKFVMTLAWRNGWKDTGEGCEALTKEGKTYNRELSSACVRAENGFRCMTTIFAVLRQPWHEDEGQQNALVWMAVGICNHCLQ